ncbi:hypothetical protein ABT324_07245 [Saccharopolyspora sp. NPDC000359]|uniref:hypothetical protein n=1 Tax=Saccharopolyspora sp. NPDC000359 TaxID=3154251 RepID=UPI00331D065B
MSGFRVNPDALQAAVDDLRGAHEQVLDMILKARNIDAGELTAGDRATQAFKDEIQKRAVGDAGSLETFAQALADKLKVKIEGYEATLREYGALDEAASVDQLRANPQA